MLLLVLPPPPLTTPSPLGFGEDADARRSLDALAFLPMAAAARWLHFPDHVVVVVVVVGAVVEFEKNQLEILTASLQYLQRIDTL